MPIHALNRGVDKRKIFMDAHDSTRFVYGLFIFNTTRPVDFAALKAKGLTMSFLEEERTGERLVDVHAWCLMGNHYHLLLSPRVENGVSLFLKKLNIGYAKYFNDRHKRSGTLFQGRTKQVLIESDAHFLHIFNYIHLNPLDFLAGCKEWRNRRISGKRAALEHLRGYKWSSFNDYYGNGSFPAIINKELFSDVFKNYSREIESYLNDLDIGEIAPLTLE
jgi:putative transposase